MALLLAVIPSAPSLSAQIGYLWSFEERLAKADLVVIARRMETRDTGVRTFHVQLPSLPVVELNTEFKVLAVLKGDDPHATLHWVPGLALPPVQIDGRHNTHRPHQGRWCYGNTPMQTFLDSLDLAKEKLVA